MDQDLDDLDALFDEVAAQSAQGKALAMAQPQVEKNASQCEGEKAEENVCRCADPDAQMYDRLGPIVRQLHDALRELGYDRSLSNVVEQVSDSQDRLQYIAQLTEQAANKVLNLVDESLPEQDSQFTQAKALHERWDLLFKGHLDVEQFKLLAKDSSKFILQSAQAAEMEKSRLMDIMMAQDFQDISGQIIKKIIALTQNLEMELAQLLHDYAPLQVKDKSVDLLSGPQAPKVALVQDDVDRMLADLGF